jgi:hyperosmotically inducible protein
MKLSTMFLLAAAASAVAAPAPPSDARLAELVRESLLSHRAAGAADARVEVDHGVVTLRGETVGEAQRAAATAYAREVPGVRRVENRMTIAGNEVTVMSTALDRMDDAATTLRVEAALFFQLSARALKTRVTTKDGVVTLAGTVATRADKDRVGAVVRGLQGVAAVDDRMAIAGGNEGD